MKRKMADLKLSKCEVFFDFDNTITPFDVLDDIIKRFSINKGWLKLEKKWERGEIGSRECLKRQMGLVKIDKSRLLGYLRKIKIDPYFKKILVRFKKEGIKPVILSDSFSFFINNILSNNAVSGIRVHSNRLNFSKTGFSLSFPHKDRKCTLCAHCKKNSLLKNGRNGKIKVYIGDGTSDLCAALHADLIFAKGRLLEHLRRRGKSCIPIKTLKDVYHYFNL